MDGDTNKTKKVRLLHLLGRLPHWASRGSIHVLSGLELGSQQHCKSLFVGND
jgi:hypothetical protein